MSSNKNKGDSGHFLELSYGKVDNILITKLLYDMKNTGKLIFRPDLFVDSGKKLKDYVSLRKYLEKEKLNFYVNNNKTIEEEIEDMKSMILKSESKEDKKEINIIHSQEEIKNDKTNDLLENKET